jgi:hypothetical protein
MTDAPDYTGPLLDWSLQAARHSPRLYRAMENARTPIVGPGDRFNPKAQNEAVMDELDRLLGRERRKAA